MYILTRNRKQIVNADRYERIGIAQNGSDYIVQAYNGEARPATLGGYPTEEEARDALLGLFREMAEGCSDTYQMPEVKGDPEERVHDARVKRKGGS